MSLGRGVLVALALCGVAGCRQKTQGPTLVTVNGEAITVEALDLERRLAGPGAVATGLLLESLVDQALILQEGRRLGVVLSQDALVAAETFSRRGTDDATLSGTLGDQGVTLKEWHERLAQAALADEVVRVAVRSKVDIGRQEIQDYYWEHLPAFRRGEHRVVRQIFSKKRAGAQAAHNELLLGSNFEEVARRRGEGPEAAQGGLLDAENRGQLPKALSAAVIKLKPKQFTGVISSPWGWHVLYLESVEHEQGDNLDQAVPKAQARLLRDKEQVLFQLWLGRLREQAKIDRMSVKPTAVISKAGL